MNLKNAKIFITGGSSGIGKATAQVLKTAGAEVLISGRNKDKLEKAGEELGVKTIQFDVSDTSVSEAKAKEAIEKLGGLDVLINNAGIGEFTLLENVEAEHFEKVFGTNVFGLAMLTKALIPHFKDQGKGNIVNISSTAGTKGFAYGTVYAASKFALRGMTQCWQAELRKENIRVMLINPSEVPTAFNQEDGKERPLEPGKLTPVEIADAIKGALEMDERGFIPELSVWATNPWQE